jgi:hypothetical protein
MSIEDGNRDDYSDLPLFDLAAGREARDEGIEQAANAKDRQMHLEEARAVAMMIARERGCVTADDVAYYYYQRGIRLQSRLGQAMGALFRGKEWKWTGEIVPSVQKKNHARLQRVWRLAV